MIPNPLKLIHNEGPIVQPGERHQNAFMLDAAANGLTLAEVTGLTKVKGRFAELTRKEEQQVRQLAWMLFDIELPEPLTEEVFEQLYTTPMTR